MASQDSAARQARRLRADQTAARERLQARAERNHKTGRKHPWLPIGTLAKSDKLSWAELLWYWACRERHHAENPNYALLGWNRFSTKTTAKVWRTLIRLLPDLEKHPPCRSFPRPADLNEAQQQELAATTRQALTIALATVLHNGQTGRPFTGPKMWDALASRFSDNYRVMIEEKIAESLFDDPPIKTVKRCRRDLLRNGVFAKKLYQLLTEKLPPVPGAPYRAHQIVTRQNGQAVDGGYAIELVPGTTLDTLSAVIEKDPAAPSHERHLLLPANKPLPRLRERRSMVAGQEFDGVRTGKETRELYVSQANVQYLVDITTLAGLCQLAERDRDQAAGVLVRHYGVDPARYKGEAGRWRGLKRGNFRNRFAQAVRYTEKNGLVLTKDQRVWMSRLLIQHDRAVAFVEANDSIRREGMEVVEREARVAAVLGLAPKLHSYILAHTGYTKTLNRRYEPTHFSPRAITPKTWYRHKAGDVRNLQNGDAVVAPGFRPLEGLRSNLFYFPGHPLIAQGRPLPPVGFDVSSSREQIYAIFLNLPDLEEALKDATAYKRSKLEKAWRFVSHVGDEPYTGMDDRRFQDMIKKLGHARGYGGEINQALNDFEDEPDVYGPSFAGETRTEQRASVEAFEATLPGSTGIAAYRTACKRLSQVAYYFQGENVGVEIVDPLDNSVSSWNPPRRVIVGIRSEGMTLSIKAPGRYVTTPAGDVAREFLKAELDYEPEQLSKQYVSVPSIVSTLCNEDTRAILEARGVTQAEGILKTVSKCLSRVETPADVKWTKIWTRVRAAHQTMRVFAPTRPDKTGAYPIDPGEMSRKVAPSVIHTLDSLFSSIIMRNADARGVPVIGTHDSWQTAVIVYDKAQGRFRPGEDVLQELIDEAGKEWLEGLGPMYDFLIQYLDEANNLALPKKKKVADVELYAPAKSWGDWARRKKLAWQRRVTACRAGKKPWPKFQVERAFTDLSIGSFWSDRLSALRGERDNG